MSQPEDFSRIKAKVCLLGNEAVGKTSLIRKFVLDQFSDEYLPTIGTKVTKREVDYKRDKNYKLSMMVWDINGKRELMPESIDSFMSYVPSTFYTGTEGVIMVCDLTRRDTLEQLPKWSAALNETVGKDVPCILLGNKKDLTDQIEVTNDNIMDINRDFDLPFFYTSAKTGENVAEAFSKLGELILDNILIQTF